jgi:hypothetical protein
MAEQWWDAQARAESEAAAALKGEGKPAVASETAPARGGEAPVTADDIDRELDAEATTRPAELRRAGFNDEETRRHVGAPAATVSKASLQARLSEVRALRTSDPRRYWGPETQAEELRTLELINGLTAGTAAPAASKAQATEEPEPTAAKAEPTAKPEGLDEIEAELAQLRELRKSDPKRYWSQEAQDREAALLAAKEQADAPNLDPGLRAEWRRAVVLGATWRRLAPRRKRCGTHCSRMTPPRLSRRSMTCRLRFKRALSAGWPSTAARRGRRASSRSASSRRWVTMHPGC